MSTDSEIGSAGSMVAGTDPEKDNTGSSGGMLPPSPPSPASLIRGLQIHTKITESQEFHTLFNTLLSYVAARRSGQAPTLAVANGAGPPLCLGLSP